MNSIVVGSTIPAFKATSGEAMQWLTNAESMAKEAIESGVEQIIFFASLEHDGRGLDPFSDLINRINEVNNYEYCSAAFWTFSLFDGSDSVNNHNRMIRICTGRNLVNEFALRHENVNWVLYLDSDLTVPPDSISKLLEMNYPIVGGDVPSYCLSGPDMYEEYPHYQVQQHWNTAGFLMVNRHIFQNVQWRADHHPHGLGLTDDPTFANDIREKFGYETRVRKDIKGIHKPLVPLNNRGHDLSLYNQVR